MVVLTEQGVWEFAETLFRSGEYFRAISEYKRLQHFFPRSRLVPPARLRIGEAYLNGGEPGEAVSHFGRLLQAPDLAPWRTESRYLRGMAYLELERELPYSLREAHIGAALEDFRALPPTWPRQAQVSGFVSALETPPDLPSRSPWLAGGLSALLPGAGSAYVGRWSEAALAFFVNALFIAATLDAAEENDDDLAFVLGVGALAFYAGNIYAAANGAHKFNDRVRAAYLEQQRVRFGVVLEPAGLSGVLEKRF